MAESRTGVKSLFSNKLLYQRDYINRLVTPLYGRVGYRDNTVSFSTNYYDRGTISIVYLLLHIAESRTGVTKSLLP